MRNRCVNTLTQDCGNFRLPLTSLSPDATNSADSPGSVNLRPGDAVGGGLDMSPWANAVVG